MHGNMVHRQGGRKTVGQVQFDDEDGSLRTLGVWELRVSDEPAYQRHRFHGFSIVTPFPKNCVGEESFPGKIRAETMSNRPPIVANWRSALLGKLLPGRYDVFTRLVEFASLLLCAFVYKLAESLFGATRNQPESVFGA